LMRICLGVFVLAAFALLAFASFVLVCCTFF
jgi:hypothetical protein